MRGVIAERAPPERNVGGLSGKAGVNLRAIPAAPELPARSRQLIEPPLRIRAMLAWKNRTDHRHHFRIEEKRADERRYPIAIDDGVASRERENVPLAFVQGSPARRVEPRPRLTHISNARVLGLEPPLAVAGRGAAVYDQDVDWRIVHPPQRLQAGRKVRVAPGRANGDGYQRTRVEGQRPGIDKGSGVGPARRKTRGNR